jgi:hypothetical protein
LTKGNNPQTHHQTTQDSTQKKPRPKSGQKHSQESDAIDKHQNTFTNLTNINLSQTKAEEAASVLQEALIEATNKTAKIAHPSEKAKPWWNAKI